MAQEKSLESSGPATRKVTVECTFRIDVDVDAKLEDEEIRFLFEDNNCPATGCIGVALEVHKAKHEKLSTCWACALGARTKVVTIAAPEKKDSESCQENTK